MDCLDSHTRPSHPFQPADSAVDEALAEGRIDRSLPFVKREGLAAVTAEYATQEAAREGIADHVTAFYRSDYPELADERAEDIQEAVAALQEVYTTNVFPSMNVTWDTYPNHIGHQRSPGCSRGKSDSGRGVDRSLPREAVNARNGSVIRAHTRCAPTASDPASQHPVR